MQRNEFITTAATTVILTLLFTFPIQAQEQRRRVQPAFPIGAGEKMLVWSGDFLAGNIRPSDGTSYGNFSSATRRAIMIELPVGTTLKRVLGDFVDLNSTGGVDLRIRLMRVQNSDALSLVEMRYFTTSGISSNNTSDFRQAVSNPLSHSMLQGWTYYIDVQWPGTQGVGELMVGAIKLIYEP